VRAALGVVLLACALGARAAGAPYLIESEFLPARAYVGEEVTLRLRLLRAPGVPYGVLRPPRLGDAADIMPFGPLRTTTVRRAGVDYEVRERAYLVVPRRAGELVLPGPELDGPLLRAREYRGAMRGAPRVLGVRPPRETAGAAWLPARRATLEESWSRDPDALSAGAPVVRTITLRVAGVSGNRLPRLEMAEPPGVRAHHEPDDFRTRYLEDGVEGLRVQRVVLMPLEEGEIGLAALSIAWWDVAADAPRTATLAGRVLRVGAALAPAAPPAAPAPASPLNFLRASAFALLALCALALLAHLRGQLRREARQRLRAACRRSDAAAAHEALKDWWQAAMRSEPAPLLGRMGEGWDALARTQLAALDAARYGGRAWEGRAFWRAVKPMLRAKAARAAPKPALPALFRLHAPGGERRGRRLNARRRPPAAGRVRPA
jgi:hypothetical protein